MKKAFLPILCVVLAVLASPIAPADDAVRLRPFVLASVGDAGLDEQVAATVAALEGAGFQVAGRHAPLESAVVLVLTDPELLAVAGRGERGGYGAAQRVSVALRDGRTEVAFVNPLYIQHAFRLQGDLQGVYDRLVAALGYLEDFGSAKGLTTGKLERYHYMIGMQRFDDPSELGEFADYATAVAAVEAGLARTGDPLTQIYRIDVPGTQQSLFGVAMQAGGEAEEEEDIDEAHQLAVVDFEGHSKAAYFPYEILVDGPRVEALHMRFRMAVHFPDLNMMGEHGFTRLMASPGATEKALESLVQER